MITNVTVYPRLPGLFEITWELNKGDSFHGNRYQILRSENRFSGFSEICEPFIDRTVYLDSPPRTGRIPSWYYKVRLYDESDGYTDWPTDGVSPEPVLDKEAFAMARNEYLGLRVGGREIICLQKIRAGIRCDECFDTVTQKKTKSKCLKCYDTTFVGGYANPIKVYGKISGIMDTNEQQKYGTTQLKRATGELPCYPLMYPDDLILEDNNTRWFVSEPFEHVRKRDSIIHQTMTLLSAPLGHVVHEMELPKVGAKRPIYRTVPSVWS